MLENAIKPLITEGSEIQLIIYVHSPLDETGV